MTKILLIEDDPNQRELLANYLETKGYQVFQAEDGRKGLKLAEQSTPDLILMDYKLPDIDGGNLLAELKKMLVLPPIIVITAFGSVETAVTALKKGAFHYLTKPINLHELLHLIEKALKEQKLERELKKLKQELSQAPFPKSDKFIAESPAMKQLLLLLKKVAQTDATVLILGESGTGKELIAEMVHELSLRKENPLVRINCAAIPKGLLESELFGHEKGAFTGAVKSKQGLFEIANKGSIFLDEIGDMDLELQAKLLRVLQNNTFTRVGGTKEIHVDVRIIAATNKNLEELVKKGLFREDLFWRLNVFALNVPPLRKRKEDIVPLARFFCQKFGRKYQKNVEGLSQEAIKLLLTHDFPGNVRELENVIERAVILAENNLILPEDLPPYLQTHSSHSLQQLMTLPLPEAIKRLEQIRIVEALKKHKNVKTKAAEELGISERVLRYKLEKMQINS